MEKLVRDKVPGIIMRNGSDIKMRVATDEEMVGLLQLKLTEEILEFRDSHDHEEIADIIEVLMAQAGMESADTIKIVAILEQKREDRGAFDKKYVLTLEDK